MTKASSKNAQKLGHKEKLVLARLLLDIEERGPMQPKYSNFSKLGNDKYHCHLSYHHVACWYNENGTYKVRCIMLVVVNQPHINNFTIKGTISDKDLKFLKNHFGENLTIKYDDDLVDFRDTDWFREVEPELTPASNLAFYRKLAKMTQTELGEKLGVSKQVISDMEHERRAISKKTARELSKIFDVSIERFI